ncbi:hypothetical protein [Acidicapsa acidisoli]|uniref:hypothetical protein n=1 Tax=Acidicapsa acidisoli TaxID=1615681 RepID=UPI0021E03968|nr:hypothetical protein [Acidicapsa acidisoli]
MDSIQIPISESFSTALEWAVAAGSVCTRIRFRIGGDLTCLLDTLRGRDLMEASDALSGRLIVHLHLPDNGEKKDASFRSAEEFLGNLRGAFSERSAPQFDIEGDSAGAAYLAIKQADCLWRTVDRPERAFADALPVLHFGKEVGLRCSVITGETREEAIEAAAKSLPEKLAGRLEQHACWMTSVVWRSMEAGEDNMGASVMIGSYGEVAAAISDYRKSGISQFLVRSSDGSDGLARFASEILPPLRASVRGRQTA